METSTQIVQIFAHVAEHPDQCYNFDIQGNLDKYMGCERNQSNFSQAAFLICDAARIYGRKVDYVEQTLLDFNRRSAANVANAIAEKQKELDEAEQTTTTTTNNNKDTNNKKSKQTEQEKREKEKEKALKRAKRMCKVTSKIEFKPKPFQIGTPEQISLNLYEERSELDLEDDYDQVRMKNVFPRINVLQSNLQSNNTFYDNLNIVEENCENLDALRDFRIFMDTIDEPIYMRPNKNRENDPQYKKECDRFQRRANQKHSNLYLSAEYVKEAYGVTLKDNSDYLNMLKYNEEVERLNLRKLSIEQLAKLKVGTYLNNILHGNKQDEEIPEFDSGIVDDIGCTDTLHDDIDIPMTDISAMNTTDEVDSCLESSVNMSIEPSDRSLNVTSEMDNTIPSSAEQTAESLNATTEGDSTIQSTVSNDITTDGDNTLPSAESTLNSTSEQPSNLTDLTLNASDGANTTSGEASKLDETNEMDRTARQSLDDGLGGSLPPLSPSRMSEFAGFDSNDVIEDSLNPIKVPELVVNIFKLPENLLRRKRIFQLTEEFDLWMAARKRKVSSNPKDPPSCGKLLKLSNGAIIRTDADSECDVNEFLGFDENNDICTANDAMVVDEVNPGAITNRTCSSDSGISPEKVSNSEDSNSDAKLPENVTEQASNTAVETVNDSGVADLSSTSELNNSTEIADQTAQETDISNVSDRNIAANSTKIFDETTSVLTGLDSGFDDLRSQFTENNSTIEDGSGDSSNVNASNEIDEAIEADSDTLMAECISPILLAESDINSKFRLFFSIIY